MDLSLGQKQAALAVVAAFQEGRICHFNGGQAGMVSADGTEFVVVDVTSGQVTVEPVEQHEQYLASYPPGPADPARAQELALHWGMGFAELAPGRGFGMLGGSTAARAIVSAMAEGRLCHFNGGQATMVAPGGVGGWVADLVSGRVMPEDQKSWERYLASNPPLAPDEEGARRLARDTGVNVVDELMKPSVEAAPRRVTARSAAGSGVDTGFEV